MTKRHPGLRIIASSDPTARAALRTLKTHALSQAFIEADETTEDQAFWGLVDFLDPSERRVRPIKGADHERD